MNGRSLSIVGPLALLALGESFSTVPGTVLKDSPREALDEATRKRLLSHSPLPPLPPDPTNAVADDPRAARLGHFLFFDARLSGDGSRSCASCHVPEKSFADGLPVSEGAGAGTRNTPSLWNVAWQRWYFWDGRADSLWAQALKPLEHGSELASNRMRIARLATTDRELARAYERVFGPPPDLSDRARFPDDARPMSATPDHAHARAWAAMREEDRATVERVFANVGKAIAAFERRLVAADSPFDRWVAALRAGDEEAERAYPEAARRGAALFVGKARCRQCHAGPAFTDDEFHDVGVPPRAGEQPFDAGRHTGLAELLADPFNAAGALSDDRRGERAAELARLVRSNESWGQFKTPSLRNVAASAPYMHQGQYATLERVLEHYSTMKDAVGGGHHGETVLKPLELTPAEIDDLAAFLGSLTDEGALERLGPPPRTP